MFNSNDFTISVCILIFIGVLFGACGVCTYQYVDNKIDVDVKVNYK